MNRHFNPGCLFQGSIDVARELFQTEISTSLLMRADYVRLQRIFGGVSDHEGRGLRARRVRCRPDQRQQPQSCPQHPIGILCLLVTFGSTSKGGKRRMDV